MLLEAGIPVVPYFSPLLPWVSDFRSIFTQCKRAGAIEFECFNFSLNNINDIIEKIGLAVPALASGYAKMRTDPVFYKEVWENIQKEIAGYAAKTKKKAEVHMHGFGDYFKNKYS